MVARGVLRTVSRSGVFPACGAVSAANDRDGADVQTQLVSQRAMAIHVSVPMIISRTT